MPLELNADTLIKDPLFSSAKTRPQETSARPSSPEPCIMNAVPSLQAVLFDVDGTLMDSNDFHVEAWRLAFEKFGLTFSTADLHCHIGKGSDQFLPVFLSKDEIPEKGKTIDEYRASLFKEQFLPQVQPFPAVPELLQRIKSAGVHILLASSGKTQELEVYKKRAHIEHLVDAMTTSDDTEKSKPHPDIFKAALEKIPNVPPSAALVIGDTPYDIEAAAKAGLRTITLLCGGFSESELKQAGAIAIYRDPADLLAHYSESPLAT